METICVLINMDGYGFVGICMGLVLDFCMEISCSISRV